MRKIAIFVEGQTELIIVREYLLRYFEYQIDILCRKLHGGNIVTAEYDYSFPEADNHFQIIDVGNDARVLSVILKREEDFTNLGYERIIGLRDMYSRAYREDCPSRIVNQTINAKFIQIHQEIIDQNASDPNAIKMCFAIMETEAWFLGLYEIFVDLDSRLTTIFINQQTNINLEEVNPETEIFHPASLVERIYGLVGKNYDKKKGDIEAIASRLSKERIEILLERQKCQSFNNFHNTIFAD